MFSITKDKNSLSYGYTEYTVDTVADIQNLPTDRAPGSVAFVIENASVYALNNNKEWKLLDGGGSGSSGGGNGGPQVQSDWNINDETDPAFIKNKPEIAPATKIFSATIPANGWIKDGEIFTQEVEVPYLVSDGLAFYDTADTNIENIEEYRKITEILVDTNLIKVFASIEPTLDLNIQFSIIGSTQDKPIYLLKPELSFDKKEVIIPEGNTSDSFNIITNSEGVISLENNNPDIYEAKLTDKNVSITKKGGYGRKKLKVIVAPTETYRQKEKNIPIIIKKTVPINLDFNGGETVITSLTFVDDSFALPPNAESIIDLSEKKDQSAMAYAYLSPAQDSAEVYVVIKGTHFSFANGNASEAFVRSEDMQLGWLLLTKIENLSYLDTSNVTEMNSMFGGSKVKTLDLSSFNTSNVTDMSNMFLGSQATTLDLSSFNTANVINMSYMFYNSQATTLDLSSFDTSNVTNMISMFYSSQATTLDLSSFDTSKVTDMTNMFWRSQATTLDLSNFNTSKVTSMYQMFDGSQATTIDLSSFDTSNVLDMSYMFYKAKATKIYCRTEEDRQRFLASTDCTPTAEMFIVGKPSVI